MSHNRQKKIAVINDFTGFGRCSIAASLPIISAMKIQCCPLPTSIFSNHTGFDSFFFTDYTKHMNAYMDEWKKHIGARQEAIIILEGVSMYFEPEELIRLLSSISRHFNSVRLLMDCYTERAARVSKYKNPINDVGVTVVYGYDNPQEIASKSDLMFEKEHSLTSKKYIDELHMMEKIVFKHLFAGRIAASMYRMYEFKKEQQLC